jgi:hypothetical protein
VPYVDRQFPLLASGRPNRAGQSGDGFASHGEKRNDAGISAKMPHSPEIASLRPE